jgi:hypothetical protein
MSHEKERMEARRKATRSTEGSCQQRTLSLSFSVSFFSQSYGRPRRRSSRPPAGKRTGRADQRACSSRCVARTSAPGSERALSSYPIQKGDSIGEREWRDTDPRQAAYCLLACSHSRCRASNREDRRRLRNVPTWPRRHSGKRPGRRVPGIIG